MKPLWIVLLIVNILTCPSRCISCDAITTEGDNVTVAACSCCHADECPASESPVPCEDGCDCQNCFCDGAVVEDGPELPVVSFEVAMWDFIWIDLGQLSDSTYFRRHQNQIPLHGQFACGRDTRIGMQSLLI